MKKLFIIATAGALLLALLLPLIRHVAIPVSAHASKMAAPQENGSQPVIRFVRNPETVQAFLAHDLDGNVVTPASWEGKVTLVVFWATLCPPCRAEIPELIRLQEKYPGQAQVIGISVDDEQPSEVKQFAQKAGINYSVVMATRDISRGFGGVPALPTTFVIDKKNGVVQRHVGLHSYEELNMEVRALLGMPVEATIQTFVDAGQVFLKNAANATDLPDVDLSSLTPKQKTIVLKRLNSEGCTCGCQLTLAECRINDTTCGISKKIAADVVRQVREGKLPGSL